MDSPSEQANKALAHLVLLNLGEESEKTLPNLYEKSIPSRVHCDVPLTVNQSKIAGAGRGVFVEKDVAARELLFGIEHPSFDRGMISRSRCPKERKIWRLTLSLLDPRD
jgi:hypothetical protein